MLERSIGKNRLNISRVKTLFYEFRLKNEIGGNRNDGSARLGDQLTDKVGRFQYLGSAVQDNRGIVKNVAVSRIRSGWMKLVTKNDSVV